MAEIIKDTQVIVPGANKSWQLIRQGYFKSLNGISYNVKIMRYTDITAYNEEELTFSGDEPLVIEWEDKAKYESVCGSSATLKLISTTDREFLQWYTVEPGTMRMDVYRGTALYWSGCMDTEFYEEPFNLEKNYEVSFTFTDFGILERVPFALKGIKTIQEIITQALEDSHIANLRTLTRISTYLKSTDESPMKLTDISVRCDNFYDEDGTPKKMMEVLEGVLCPLNLKILQKNGRIGIFDINAITSGTPIPVDFVRSDANLSVDNIYNNVKLTFSPYGVDELLSSEITPDRNAFMEDDASEPDVANDTMATFCANLDYNNDRVDLAIFHGFDAEAELEYLNPDYGQYCKMVGSDDHLCIMHGFRHYKTFFWTGAGSENPGCDPTIWGLSPNTSSLTRAVATAEKFRTKQMFIPNIRDVSTGVGIASFGINIKLEMLIDSRYNPMHNASVNNFIDEYNYINDNVEYVVIPVHVKLKDKDGNVLYHWVSQYGLDETSEPYENSGHWEAGDIPTGTYSTASLIYIKKDRSCPVLDWSVNNHTFAKENSHRLYTDDNEGQVLPFPPCEGYLQISVLNDYSMYYWNTPTSAYIQTSAVSINFFMLKVPTITIVKTNTMKEECTVEDYEYNADCNQYAQEELGINTICGSAPTLNPSCRGVYLLSASQLPMADMYLWNDGVATRQQLNLLHRNGVTDTPENLLLRTMVGQYSARHMKLTGTVNIQTNPLPYANYEVTTYKYLITSDRQDLQQDTSEVSMVQIFPDGKNSAGTEITFTKKLLGLDSRPRSKRLRQNNIALVKKEARRKISGKSFA